MIWNEAQILQSLKKLHRSGANLSYNAMTRKHQSLLSAAAYHFGSYRRAIERAGIDYAGILQRPRWTRARIVGVIKNARRKNRKLHWWAVTRRRDELAKAAFASLQDRLFGSWDRALHAAGLDTDEVNRYRKWDHGTIVAELKSCFADEESISSGAMQKSDPGLHAAALRYFKSYDRALLAAGVSPAKVRRRRSWNETEVIRALKAAKKKGKSLSSSSLREMDAGLFGAAVRLFGGLPKARSAAGIKE